MYEIWITFSHFFGFTFKIRMDLVILPSLLVRMTTKITSRPILQIEAFSSKWTTYSSHIRGKWKDQECTHQCHMIITADDVAQSR